MASWLCGCLPQDHIPTMVIVNVSASVLTVRYGPTEGAGRPAFTIPPGDGVSTFCSLQPTDEFDIRDSAGRHVRIPVFSLYPSHQIHDYYLISVDAKGKVYPLAQ